MVDVCCKSKLRSMQCPECYTFVVLFSTGYQTCQLFKIAFSKKHLCFLKRCTGRTPTHTLSVGKQVQNICLKKKVKIETIPALGVEKNKVVSTAPIKEAAWLYSLRSLNSPLFYYHLMFVGLVKQNKTVSQECLLIISNTAMSYNSLLEGSWTRNSWTD